MEEKLLENKNNYREEKIVYFEKPGKGNTEVTLDLVAERAKTLGIKKIVLASTRGVTARMAMERFKDSGIQLIVVPHQYGFDEPERFQPEVIGELESKWPNVGDISFCRGNEDSTAFRGEFRTVFVFHS